MRTVLIVDDDPELVEVLVEVLSDTERLVLGAETAAAALRLVEQHPVELLVADVKLPDMDGFALARRARVLRPRLHVVYISGSYTEAEREAQPLDGLVLRKPFDLRGFTATVNRELGPSRNRKW